MWSKAGLGKSCITCASTQTFKNSKQQMYNMDSIVRTHMDLKKCDKYMLQNLLSHLYRHLHLELCKISREINSMFGIQLTFKMGLYFGLIASCLRVIFSIALISNYIDKRNEFLAVIVFWGIVYAFQVLLINYICERVSVKVSIIFNFYIHVCKI